MVTLRATVCPRLRGPYRRKSTEQRFWGLVSKGPGHSDCWTWTGARASGGYGKFFIEREGGHANGRPIFKRAHRFAWESLNGPVPEGMELCHRCDNRLCVRLDHLFLGTHADNMEDMARKGRAACGSRSGARLHLDRLPRGDRHGKAKLTAEQVESIKARWGAGEMQIAIAADLGISSCHVSRLVRGLRRGEPGARSRHG